MRRFVLSSCLAVVAVTTGAALADSTTNSLPEAASTATNRLPEVVVTGTRIPSETECTPIDVTVLQGDELTSQQIRTVSDALREVPGVGIVQRGQPGGQTSVFLRGGNANHTLVLIDGIRVNDGFNSQFDFSNLSMDNVDRIEVLRGPQSTLYGSEAIGGVINIITKTGSDKPTGAATFEGGSFNSIRPSVSFADTVDKLSFSGASSYFSTDNQRVNSILRQRNINASARYQFLERLDLTISGWYRSSHAGSPGPDTAAPDLTAFLNDENSQITATLHARPLDCWDARLTLSHNHDRLFWSDDLWSDYSWVTTDRDQIDFQNVLNFSEQHKLLLGVAFDNDHVNRIENDFGTTLIAPTRRSYAGYGQYEFTPIQRLTFTAGTRVDSFSDFGSEMTYRVGARATVPHTETIFRANVGTGFRAPSLSELYYPLYSNPNLRPERSIGWDAGFEQPLCDNKLHIGANYFQNQYENLISSQAPLYIPENLSRARTIGTESFVAWTPVTNLLVRGSYTWLPVAEDETLDQRLTLRPRHSGELLANYRFCRRFGAMIRSRFVGEHQDSTTITTDGYVKLDIGFSCDVCKYFTVFGRVENVTDENYHETAGYPALGRSFWGGATAKF